jgi:hypothetical protein
MNLAEQKMDPKRSILVKDKKKNKTNENQLVMFVKICIFRIQRLRIFEVDKIS